MDLVTLHVKEFLVSPIYYQVFKQIKLLRNKLKHSYNFWTEILSDIAVLQLTWNNS